MIKKELTAKLRTEKGRMPSKKIRREGFVPAVIYGQAQDPVQVLVSTHDIEVALHNPMGKNVAIDLAIEGSSKPAAEFVMIKEMQRDPVSQKLLHVDFYRLDMEKPVSCEVPVKETGRSIGVHEGGRIDHLKKFIQIRCLPSQVPDVFLFDITNMKIKDVFCARDIVPPEGVEVLTHPEVALLRIAAPRTAAVEVAEGAIAEGEEVAEGEAPEGEAPADA